ncbi:citrate/2-methylcitrate synthase, partial [Mammaliicoccus sciuri]|uniref:citrate/2-methylcitrate synthase n=1 Tax=Mammaliicoccus sciuri TaxID=1296 RepID=UPI000D415FCF
VVFLLWNYRLPTKDELNKLQEKLYEYAKLDQKVYEHFEDYATDDVHPMTALRTSVSYIAHFDENAESETDEEKLERAIRIQAKMESLVTSFERVRQGKETVYPKQGLCYAANVLYMLRGEEPTDIEVEAFNKALV